MTTTAAIITASLVAIFILFSLMPVFGPAKASMGTRFSDLLN
jgi:hypothetical protein